MVTQISRRGFLAGTAAAIIVVPTEAVAAALRPEDFGAVGDGRTNDTVAFQRLASAINTLNGGTIALRPNATYVVGSQSRGNGGWGWKPNPILEFRNLQSPLIIVGHGARLVAQSGLRFGTFNLQSGKPVQHSLPYVNSSDLAAPYEGMIVVRECTADIAIGDIELDGNMTALHVGGEFGDAGWQAPGTGILLVGNLAGESLHNVHTHHHPQDGAMIIGDARRKSRGSIRGLVSQYNGRQALSLTSGRGYDFTDCELGHSGRSVVKSPPSAGVDLEAEGGPIRDVTFNRCGFVDNAGCGLVADSGDVEGAKFTDCRFVGTTSWSAWPNKPAFSFNRCVFVGAVAHAFPNASPARATKFVSCTFTDDPKLSPSGKVFTGGEGPIVNLAKSDNVLFDQCRFRLVGYATLPWSWRAIYRSCSMSQRSNNVAMPKGRYLGHTDITAPVDLYGSMIEGTVVVKGYTYPHGPVGVKPW